MVRELQEVVGKEAEGGGATLTAVAEDGEEPGTATGGAGEALGIHGISGVGPRGVSVLRPR